jgi:hypothetical protein
MPAGYLDSSNESRWMKWSLHLQAAIMLVVLSCHGPGRKVVAGIPLPEATTLLKEAGYNEITDGVGIKIRAHTSWWISPENTCVTIIPNNDGSRVEWIYVGEKGKGYEGQSGWHSKDPVEVIYLK